MERFLGRSGYAEDRILEFFARLIGDQFFVQKKDILVKDEGINYRSPLIAALIESYIEDLNASVTSKMSGSEEGTGEKQARIRALVLTEHEEVLANLRKLFAIAHFDSLIVSSDEALKEANKALSERAIVAMPASLFLAATQGFGLKAREFGFVVIEGADLFGDMPSEVQRRIWGYLLPPWQRRAVLFAEHIGIRTKNMALDFANDPETVILNKAQASLSQINTYMYRLNSQQKFKALLALIQENSQEGRGAIIVLCNLRQTLKELELRLELNHIKVKHISAADPNAERKALFMEFTKIEKEADKSQFVLVVSNDNLRVLPSEFASLAIHYDIPLDPDIYLERVRIMRPKASTIIGLVCERYEVGLSAINSRFGLQFELREPTQSMLEYRDESEGIPLRLEFENRSSGQKAGRSAKQSKGPMKGEGPKSPQKAQHKKPIEDFHQSKRASQSKQKNLAQESPREDQGSELYSMSTDERLAYFRKKYRGFLDSPTEPKLSPKKEENTRSKPASAPLSFEKTIEKTMPAEKANRRQTASVADSVEANKGDENEGGGAKSDSPGIVKRFIERFFSEADERKD